MANKEIQKYTDMVDMQVASEAFLHHVSSPTLLEAALKIGNKNNSKFPDPLAAAFKTRFILIAHQDLSLNPTTIGEVGTAGINDKSGFSASLFLDKDTGQYTLSIRSTEFASNIRDVGKGGLNLAWYKLRSIFYYVNGISNLIQCVPTWSMIRRSIAGRVTVTMH